jgi:RNA polymerase sigma-70 factor (ECF subfamily)
MHGVMTGGEMGLARGSESVDAGSLAAATLEPELTVVARGALVERARAGDREAFEALVERWLVPSLRTAYAIIGNEADARDATQDAFLRAWRELPRLRDPASFDAWFNRILVNRCRTLRSRGRRTTVREIHLSILPEPSEPAAFDPPGDDGAVSPDAFEHAFCRLSMPDRSILVLHHLQHRPLADVAAGLGIPVGTAKSRLFAARKALERALEVELR